MKVLDPRLGLCSRLDSTAYVHVGVREDDEGGRNGISRIQALWDAVNGVKIVCSEASAELLPLVLEDALHENKIRTYVLDGDNISFERFGEVTFLLLE